MARYPRTAPAISTASLPVLARRFLADPHEVGRIEGIGLAFFGSWSRRRPGPAHRGQRRTRRPAAGDRSRPDTTTRATTTFPDQLLFIRRALGDHQVAASTSARARPSVEAGHDDQGDELPRRRAAARTERPSSDWWPSVWASWKSVWRIGARSASCVVANTAGNIGRPVFSDYNRRWRAG